MGSFDPRFHVKDNTVKLAENLGSGAMRRRGLLDWAFGHYLAIAPPEFAGPAPPARRAAGGKSAPSLPLHVKA